MALKRFAIIIGLVLLTSIPAWCQLPTPVFSPTPGTYTSSQTIAISLPSGATQLCVSASPDIGPNVGLGGSSACVPPGFLYTSGQPWFTTCDQGTCTYYAYALSAGSISAVATGKYTITGSSTVPNYPSGWSSGCSGMAIDNMGVCQPPSIYLIPYTPVHNTTQAFSNNAQNVQAFTSNFTFHISCANATTGHCGNGIAFIGQSNPNNHNQVQGGPYHFVTGDADQLGWNACHLEVTPVICPFPGGDLPYYGFMFPFSMTNYAGSLDASHSMTGFYLGPNNYGENWANSFYNDVPMHDMIPSGIDLTSGDEMAVAIIYDGTNASMTITDATAGTSYTAVYNAPGALPASMQGSSGFVGFSTSTAQATQDSFADSWVYTTHQTQAFPATANVSPAVYTGTQSVSLSTVQSGGSIFYNTTGSPNCSSTAYSGAISVTSTETIYAVVCASGLTNSPVTINTYTINGSATVAATPTFSPAAGSYGSVQTLNLSTTTSTTGTRIYYTTDGSTPNLNSALYYPGDGAIQLKTPTETVKAIAWAPGLVASGVGSAAYTIGATCAKPTFSLTPGTYAGTQTVTVSNPSSCPVMCANINGTPQTNGATGCTFGKVVSGPLTIDSNQVLDVVAGGTSKTDSVIAEAPFQITPAVTAVGNKLSGNVHYTGSVKIP